MTHCGHDHGRQRSDWHDVGSAAEDFARRVARDASKFGERLAEHASAFAGNISREWRRHQRHGTEWRGDDVRAVLKEVRGILTDVVDGVDELIERFVRPSRESEPPEGAWTRVVTSREVTCGSCARPIGAGEECHLRRREGGREFRCIACGPTPVADAPAS